MNTVAKKTVSGEVEQEPVVCVRGLEKSYGALRAVKELDFDIFPGEIFGLIGPDGAGKTTTFHILGGVMEKSAGKAVVLSGKPRDVRLEIGYLTQQFSLYQDLSILENLRYVAGLREVEKSVFQERSSRYLKLMSLDKFGDRLAGQLSGGMKQKLALCCALIARPKLLLLDEPTTGVDPVSRREFWDLLATVTQEGVTVAVATPYLDEAERCNRLILMHEGKVKEAGTPAELKDGLHLHRLEVRCNKLEVMERKLYAIEAQSPKLLADIQTFGDRLDVLVEDNDAGEKVIAKVALDEKVDNLTIERQEPTLENVFVARLKSETGASDRTSFPFTGWGDKLPEHAAIMAENVRKIYGSFNAVKDVSLQVAYGEIYGLLGANGAGKTTTIKMLCGLIKPSAGKMALCGQVSNLRSAALRQRLGYMSQKFTLYDDLSIRENLEFYCGVYCVPEALKLERINWVLRNSDLLGQESLMAGKLPGGWKQRLSFGAAVMHQPEVLFLDEPTSGVDPLARREMWRSIREFARQGTAILVTTHFLEEAEYCNNLGFMVAGSLVAEGAPGQVKASQPGKLLEMRFADPQSAYLFLKQQIEPWRVSRFADSLHIVFDDPEAELPAFRAMLEKNSLPIVSQRELGYSLEDAFISIVQRAVGAADQ
jgi:ABC-2 type transport system ATP-binding protein